MSYLTRLRKTPQSAPLAGPGPEQRRRLRLGGRRLGAAAPLPDPRLGGRQLLRRRAEADARERRGGRALPRGRRRCARSRRSSRSARPAARRRTTRRVFALAMAAGAGDEATRRAALEALPRVCRTATHLFQFVDVRRGLPRLGPRRCGVRSAAGTRRRSAESLAYQAVKYRQREGVTHRDVLRLAHPAGRVERGQPDARADRRAPPAVRVDRPRRRDRRPAARWSRASRSPRRRRRRPGRPSSCASTACRARRSRAST